LSIACEDPKLNPSGSLIDLDATGFRAPEAGIGRQPCPKQLTFGRRLAPDDPPRP